MSTLRKIWMLGGLTIATVGLSNCSDNGAVDPAPPPLDCQTAGPGEDLFASAQLSGMRLTITIGTNDGSTWKAAPKITNVTGGTVISDKETPSEVVFVVELDALPADGGFTITGHVTDGQLVCAVQRHFKFTESNGSITVSRAPDLPLPIGTRTAIAVEQRDGHAVELAASGPLGGVVTWSVTGGLLDSSEPQRARWELPAEPGLYQVELVVDRGAAGLSIDTLTLEVG